MGQLWERHYPFILGLATTALLLWLDFRPGVKGYEKVLDGVITFSSIVVGFLAALLAIILSISKSKVMKHLYEHVHHANGKNLFLSYFRQAIFVGFVVVLLSIWMYIIKEHNPLPSYGFVGFVLWIFTGTFFVGASFRIVNILMKALFLESTTSAENKYRQSRTLTQEQIDALKRENARQ
jgi:hypothetical protein